MANERKALALPLILPCFLPFVAPAERSEAGITRLAGLSGRLRASQSGAGRGD